MAISASTANYNSASATADFTISPGSYSITYNLNGGAQTGAPANYTFGTEVVWRIKPYLQQIHPQNGFNSNWWTTTPALRINRLYNANPFIPWNDVVHDFQKFFPLRFLLAVAVFHIAQCLLLHRIFPSYLWYIYFITFGIQGHHERLNLGTSPRRDIARLSQQSQKAEWPELQRNLWLMVFNVLFDSSKLNPNYDVSIMLAAERLAGFHLSCENILLVFNNFSSSYVAGDQKSVWRIRQKGKWKRQISWCENIYNKLSF